MINDSDNESKSYGGKWREEPGGWCTHHPAIR
jgi:hypothetical protein